MCKKSPAELIKELDRGLLAVILTGVCTIAGYVIYKAIMGQLFVGIVNKCSQF